MPAPSFAGQLGLTGDLVLDKNRTNGVLLMSEIDVADGPLPGAGSPAV